MQLYRDLMLKPWFWIQRKLKGLLSVIPHAPPSWYMSIATWLHEPPNQGPHLMPSRPLLFSLAILADTECLHEQAAVQKGFLGSFRQMQSCTHELEGLWQSESNWRKKGRNPFSQRQLPSLPLSWCVCVCEMHCPTDSVPTHPPLTPSWLPRSVLKAGEGTKHNIFISLFLLKESRIDDSLTETTNTTNENGKHCVLGQVVRRRAYRWSINWSIQVTNTSVGNRQRGTDMSQLKRSAKPPRRQG